MKVEKVILSTEYQVFNLMVDPAAVTACVFSDRYPALQQLGDG